MSECFVDAQAYALHGNAWRYVATIVRTRTVTQIRTHAQKYLIKLSKAESQRNKVLHFFFLMGKNKKKLNSDFHRVE